MKEEQIRECAANYLYNEFTPTGIITEDRLKCFIAGAHSRDEEVKELRNPWISVEDRLPEEGQIVFVHMQGGSADSAIYTNGAFERSLQLKFGTNDGGYTIISWQQKCKSNITHWMPIPQIKK